MVHYGHVPQLADISPSSAAWQGPPQRPECTLHQLLRFSKDWMLKGCKQNPVSKSKLQISQQKHATGAHLNLTRERFGTSVWLPLWHFNSFLCCCGNDMAKGANISFVTPPAAQKRTHAAVPSSPSWIGHWLCYPHSTTMQTNDPQMCPSAQPIGMKYLPLIWSICYFLVLLSSWPHLLLQLSSVIWDWF